MKGLQFKANFFERICCSNLVTRQIFNSALHHSAERCISPPFYFSSPLSLETCNPPTPLPFPLDTQHGKKLWYMIQILWYSRVRETKNNIKPWKPIAYRKCVSTECVLIDILVTIRIAVGAGCNFPHGKVGTKFHHIKIYNRLTIS